jgi:aminoglycoside 6'-N-acetyltransferase I
MKIRPAQPEDAGAWTAMRHDLWPEEDRAELSAEVDAYFAGQGQLRAAFICEDAERRCVGFVELSLRSYSEGCSSSPVPHVEGWYVVPDARRRGCGQALLAAAEEWARDRGFSELASDTWLWNEISARAHLKAGFEEVERAIHFRKMLT